MVDSARGFGADGGRRNSIYVAPLTCRWLGRIDADVSLGKISVNYLSVPFSEHLEQSASIAQCVNGVLLVRRFDGTFKPGGYVWICKDLFERHSYFIRLVIDPVLKQLVCPA
jgi:hypothetical protein